MSKLAISSAEFNGEAKQLRADDNLPALKALAAKLVGSPRNEDLRQTLHAAAIAAATNWWDNGGKLPYDRVMKAVRAAVRNFRGEGGYRDDNVWRGGYDSDRRKFSSQLPETYKALSDVMDGAVATEAPDAREADERDQRDAELDRLREHNSERAAEREAEKRGAEGGANIATGAAVLEAGAERTSHDGAHADDVRVDPRDDGERAYGVDGATRGLHTGTMAMRPYEIALHMAIDAECSDSDRAFLLAIDKAGGFENYVNKDGHRKAARAALEARRDGIEGRLKRRTLAILEAAGDFELQTAWLAAQAKERGYRAVGTPGKYRAEQAPIAPSGGVSSVQGGVLSSAWSKESPARKPFRAKHYSPERIGPYGMFRVEGLDWADQVRNVRAWRKVEAFYRRMGWGQAVAWNAAEGVLHLIHVWPPDGVDV